MQRGITPIRLDDALDIFMLDVQARRLTEHTTKFYQSTLHIFITWCKSQGIEHLHQVTRAHWRMFLAGLEKQGLSSATQHKYARALKAFFNFAVNDELLEASPFAKVQMPKLEQKVLKSFTQDEIKRILKACLNERDKAIVLMLLDSGLRANELASLNVQDIDLKTGAVTVHNGKGQKGRITYIGARTRKQLLRYFAARGRPQGSSAAFVSENTGKRLTVWGVGQAMGRIGERAGVHVTCHAFRRTFAIEFLRGGGNIYVLAKLMGHAGIEMLRRYLAITDDDLKAAHEKYSPGDNMR
jgi:site-specific recombinase XerD